VIKGIHGMFYSKEPEALPGFLRDKLARPAVDIEGTEAELRSCGVAA
jgi:hypothetical protein